MDKNFCRRIDKELLVEQYVSGKLKGDLLDQFETHISECETHAQAVILEKAFKRGTSDFARNEIKANLRQRIEKRREIRFMMLRYAAVLLVAVITPLLLYYQFQMSSTEILTSNRQVDDFQTPNKAAGDSALAETIPAGQSPAESESAPESVVRSVDQEDAAPPVATRGKAADHSSAAGEATAMVREAPLRAAKQAAAPRKMRSEMDTHRLIPLPAGFVESKDDSLRRCVDEHLAFERRSGYRVHLLIDVTGTGNVNQVTFLDGSESPGPLEECIMALVRTWKLDTNDMPGQINFQWEYTPSADQ